MGNIAFYNCDIITSVAIEKSVATIIETYHNQNDYTMAELLAVNMLLDDPDNEEAAGWLEKIRQTR